MSEPPKKSKAGPAKLLLIAAAFAGGAAAGGAGAVMAFTALGNNIVPSLAHAAAPADSALAYVEIDNAFTSNLVDTGRYLQLRIAVSTTGGEATVAALTLHKPAIVAAVLAILGDCSESDIADRGAKAKLRLRLRDAIDGVLKAKAGGGRIDEVFMTSLVVQ